MQVNKKRIIAILIGLALLIPIVIASTFTCSGNTCSGSDTVTFSDNPSLHSSLLSPITDKFTLSDKSILIIKIFKFMDKVLFSDIASLVQNAIVTITITVTNTVTSISNGCTGTSCFVNPGGNNTEAFAEQLVAPLAFIVITAFCFMYVGLRFFGVIDVKLII